jgi:hypothetical protein
VAVAAVLVRAVFLPQVMQRLPFYREPRRGLDTLTYHNWAVQIAGGDLLSRNQGKDEEQKAFYYAPLYPYMLAGAYAVTGHRSVLVGAIMNGFFGVACALCAAGLAWRLFGWGGGLVAGVLAALNGSQVSVEAMLLVDSVLPALCIGSLWLIVELRGRRASPALAWLLPGALLGVAAVGRGSNVLVAGALCLMLALPALKMRRPRAVLPAALLGLGMVGVVAAPVLRNGLMYGTWTLTTNGPVNLYIGNAPGAPGILGEPTGFAQAKERVKGDPSRWVVELRRELKAQPWTLPKMLGRKMLLFFNSWDAPDNGNYYFVRRYVPALRLFCVGPLAIYTLGFLGILLAVRQWRELMPLYVFGAAFAASIIIVFVSGRYKLPFLALLCVFAGGIVPATVGQIKARKMDLPIASALAAVLVSLAFQPRGPVGYDKWPGLLRPHEFLHNAEAMSEVGRTDEAIAMLEDGAARFPKLSDSPKYQETLVKVYYKGGRVDLALARIEALLRERLYTKNLLKMRVRCYERLGMFDRARQASRELLHAFPDDHVGKSALGRPGD